MIDFPLSNIPPILLERVINKLEGRSYTRIQKTCREVHDFIRSNQNIKGIRQFRCMKRGSVSFSLTWEQDENGASHLQAMNIDIESLYGIRCDTLSLPSDACLGHLKGNEFEAFCAALKKYRITCDKIARHHTDSFTMEQCQALFGVLKPIEVIMGSILSNRWEAALLIKNWTKLHLWLHPEAAVNATIMLLPKCRELEIYVTHSNEGALLTPNKLYNIFKEVLEVARNHPPSWLFSCTIRFNLLETRQDKDKARRMFKEFEPIVESLCRWPMTAQLSLTEVSANLLYYVCPSLEKLDINDL